MMTRSPSRRSRSAVALTSASLGVLLLAACGGGQTDEVTQTDSGGPITVWVDPPRVPAAEAFHEARSEIETTIDQIDGTAGSRALSQQSAPSDAAGEGWPDAISFPSDDDIAWAAGAQIDDAADLTDQLPDLVEDYDPAVLAPCDIDGEIRCLRDDAAPDVFWYDATFFEQDGYTPPTTWEEFGDLAVQIASEHPGRTSGFLGGAYAPDRCLWASGCPTDQRISETSVSIDLQDPRCQRAEALLDQMVEGGAVSSLGIFDADAAAVGQDLVMSPGAVWWGDHLFRQTWKIDAGTMTATTPLTWSGDSQPSTGNEGGGLCGTSSHISGEQSENALTFATFVATDPRWQVELSTGMPAHGSVQDQWIDEQEEQGCFADDDATFAAAQEVVGDVPGDHAHTLSNTGGIWTETVAESLVAGDGSETAWDAFGSELVNQAESQGHEVQAAP